MYVTLKLLLNKNLLFGNYQRNSTSFWSNLCLIIWEKIDTFFSKKKTWKTWWSYYDHGINHENMVIIPWSCIESWQPAKNHGHHAVIMAWSWLGSHVLPTRVTHKILRKSISNSSDIDLDLPDKKQCDLVQTLKKAKKLCYDHDVVLFFLSQYLIYIYLTISKDLSAKKSESDIFQSLKIDWTFQFKAKDFLWYLCFRVMAHNICNQLS